VFLKEWMDFQLKIQKNKIETTHTLNAGGEKRLNNITC
jgi:hypothetical protein